MKPTRSGRIATMQDVAQAAKVSSMTVSNAFRHPHRVQEATRLKVLEAAFELGYVPNLAAGHLAAGKSLVIGAAVPSVRNSSFYKYVTGLRDGCDAHGHKLIVMVADTLQQEREAVETFIGLRVAGIVLIGNDHDPSTIDLLGKSSIPLVESWLLGEPLDMAIGYRIDEAVRAACRHHIAAGRRRIALVGNDSPGTRRFKERPPVFREEMRKAGLPEHLIVDVDEPHGFSSGRQALDALLALEGAVDAVICPTDVVAASMVFECTRRGIDVPGQIAIIGWGDYEIASTISPSLTTVKPHPWEMGNGAIAMLMEHNSAEIRHRTVDTGFGLIVRESA
ncbi:LacI family DNA-binding transcriptional regulator [Chelativorans sp. AA-79]|uniref:LacI family DNA-binding transcriptional regulator n=1 Tax=Chelativorans sp. AA-79 TaxID=3028735 RepID=UPI0023F872BE|nr:LacI family DNA-binding transcriptional regulator [Chelativorans sp. AA-79]WEX08906.1 LacI family DNA-binding transcriptional regulator [Chelativorans sp. AA-79]